MKACEKLVAAGIVIIVAAGNDRCDSCLQTPSFAPHVITVGASTPVDTAAVFSDFGKCIDLYAPGLDVISACAGNLCSGQEDKYVEMSGTSMAAPHAAGVAAQIMQLYPDATADDVADMLSCAAVPMVLDIGLDETTPTPTFSLSTKERKELFRVTSVSLNGLFFAQNQSSTTSNLDLKMNKKIRDKSRINSERFVKGQHYLINEDILILTTTIFHT
jgi:hypothetical protein